MGSQCSVFSNGVAWRLEDDPSSIVLRTLQLPDGVGWSTVEHSIAVINPGQDCSGFL